MHILHRSERQFTKQVQYHCEAFVTAISVSSLPELEAAQADLLSSIHHLRTSANTLMTQHNNYSYMWPDWNIPDSNSALRLANIDNPRSH